jgi:hypothetical protein
LALLAKNFGRDEAPMMPAAALLATAGDTAANEPSARNRADEERHDQSPNTLSAIRSSRRRLPDSRSVDAALQSADLESLRGVRMRTSELDDDAATRRMRFLRR